MPTPRETIFSVLHTRLSEPPATGPFAELSRLVAQLVGSGDASPTGLMFLGLGLIGMRDRIERGFCGDA